MKDLTKALKVIAIIVGVVILVGIGFIVLNIYVITKHQLVKENARLAVPYKLLSQTYSAGLCLDNCPSLVSLYSIPATTVQAESARFTKLIEAKGYSGISDQDGGEFSKGSYSASYSFPNEFNNVSPGHSASPDTIVSEVDI